MFFEGDLQSGISLAIQEQKLVAVFVRQDDDHLSQLWEEEWLQSAKDGEGEKGLGDRLADKAVFLRIDAGTQEAGFLSAFCSLSAIPKLLIIHQGTVLEDIDSTASKEEFTKRLVACIEPPSATNETNTAPADVSQLLPESVREVVEPHSPPATPAPEPVAPSSSQTTDRDVQDALAERAARLETDHQKQRTDEGAALKAARKRASEKKAEVAESSSAPGRRQDWLEQQRSRQQEARLEKERILKTIESDKKARRERDQQRKQLAQADGQSGPNAFVPQTTDSSHGRSSPTCSLQIRLFDGTSIRSRFESTSTLSTSVRTWIAEQSSTDVPYNFRQMMTPLPSRTIEVSEENESLQSLGLTPSATLVLVPVKGYTEAYAQGGASGLIYKGVHAGYSLVSGAAGLVGGLLGFGGDGPAEGPYMGGVADEREPSNSEGSRMAEDTHATGPSSGIKIRTLADQRAEDQDTELYNGNQLNFEPRKKDDTDETNT